MEAMKLSEAKEAAMAAYMAAKAAHMAVEADKDADVESYVRAEFTVADAKAASDKAQAAETVEMAEQYQTMAEAAQTEVEMYAGMVTAAHNKMVMDDMADAAMVAMTKAANTKRAAIMKLGEGIRDDDGVKSDKPNGYVVKRKDGAVSEIDDPLSFPSLGEPSFKNMDDKWVRDNGEGTTEVVSANTFGRGSGSRQSFFRKYVNHMIDVDADPENVSETLSIGVGQRVGQKAGEEITSFPADKTAGIAVSTSFSIAETPNSVAFTDGGGPYDGKFDGVSGEFTCVSGCTSTGDGRKSTLAGEWNFKPTSLRSTVSTPDADYLEYGFWLKKTVKDGVTTYNEVKTFADGIGSYKDETDFGDVGDGADADTIVGTATYEGDAAGVYVHDNLGAGGAVESSTSGTFTADVSLTAHFGGPDVAINKKNTIDGSISNFDLSGGESDAWRIGLKADFDSDPDAPLTPPGIPSGTFKGAANGGGTAGSWRGMFRGEASGTGFSLGDRLAPPAVTGEFNANFINGNVAGAFGAEKK